MPRYAGGGGGRRGPSREESLTELTGAAMNLIGPPATGLDRVSGAVVSNKVFAQPQQQQQRSMLTEHNRNGTLGNNRLTFRHKPNYMSPAEKTKLVSYERGDQVYEKIASKEEVPGWLGHIAKAPARESRQALFRHETADEEELQPEYVPPHLDPIPPNIVSNEYWKQNPRKGQGLAEARVKERVTVPSIELPNLQEDAKFEQPARRQHNRVAEPVEESHRRSNKRKKRKRHRSPTFSEGEEDEEAMISKSYLEKERASIRDQPGIVAGGAAVIRSPPARQSRRPVRHDYPPYPPTRYAPPVQQPSVPLDLEQFRFQPGLPRALPPTNHARKMQMSPAEYSSPHVIAPAVHGQTLIRPLPHRPPIRNQGGNMQSYPGFSRQPPPINYNAMPRAAQTFSSKMAQAVPNFRNSDQAYNGNMPLNSQVMLKRQNAADFDEAIHLLKPPAQASSSPFTQPISAVQPLAMPTQPFDPRTQAITYTRGVQQAEAMAQSGNAGISQAVRVAAAGTGKANQPDTYRTMLHTAAQLTNVSESSVPRSMPFQRDLNDSRAQTLGHPNQMQNIQNVQNNMQRYDTADFDELLTDGAFDELQEDPSFLAADRLASARPAVIPEVQCAGQIPRKTAIGAPTHSSYSHRQAGDNAHKQVGYNAQQAHAQKVASNVPSKHHSHATSARQSNQVTPRTNRRVATHSELITPMPIPGAPLAKASSKKQIIPTSEPRLTRSATKAAREASSKQVASSSSHKYSDSMEEGGRTNTPATSEGGLMFGGKKFDAKTMKLPF